MHHRIYERSAQMPQRRRASRLALMGAAAALAFGVGAGAPVRPAFAEAPSVSVGPAAGPASFADVVERVKGAVVAIKVKAVEESQNPFEGQGELSPDDPMYRFFKRFGETPQKRMTQSQGSGFIISADGYVVTNNHVVEHANDVEVALDDGRTLSAKVIGTDKRTDLALLKVNDGNKLPYVEWASAQPRVGDWVIAVGNPFGLGGSVTAGIVSARGRDIGAGPYDDFLQIDAPVNRGNSGGPAFDSHGNVVGVNTAIYSPSGGSVGIGFAIPSEVAKDVVAALKDKGVVSRGWIGVKIQQVTPEIAESLGLKSTKGALIAQPQRGAPAEAAGLKAGDVITAVNGEKIETPRELARKIAAMGPSKSVDLTYIRNGSEKNAKLTLGKLPEEKEARADEEDFGGAPTGHANVASLGVEVAPAAEVRGAGGEGLVVTDIDPSGAAAQKGVRRGDVIVEAGGQPVSSRGDLANAIDGARKEGRRSVLLRIKSADGAKFIAVPVKQSAG
ncbi:Do family serine endopeptidase [Methylocystis parvus]|uniref:Do family serine endopeptidase n=1 Tax=Methylocystis parvus TaxID=134 RepID=UPI003C732FA1